MYGQAHLKLFKHLKQPLQNGTTSLVFRHNQVSFHRRTVHTIPVCAQIDCTCGSVGAQDTDLNQALLSSVLQASS